MEREIHGNLSTLTELGYSPLYPCFGLSQIDEEVIRATQQMLAERKHYLLFREGGVHGYFWYNNFLEKWFCDVMSGEEYLETLLGATLAELVTNVQVLYARDPHSGVA